MSNPGVIVLSSLTVPLLKKMTNILQRKKNIRFQIEDNIGECIHIHFDDLRLDLTIEEFYSFSSSIESVFFNYLDEFNPIIKKIPPSFLANMSKHVQYIESINIVNKKLSEMQVVEYTNLKLGLYKIKSLKNALAVSYLQGDNDLFDSYVQNGFSPVNNRQRLCEIADSIKEFGYPHNGEYIVVFKGQNIIRDGQHRAAILLTSGIEDVPVLEVEFKKGYSGYKINTGLVRTVINQAILLIYFMRSTFGRIIKIVRINFS